MTYGKRGLATNTMLSIAGVVGLAVLLALWLIGPYGFFWSLVLGILVCAVVFLILYYGFGLPDAGGAPVTMTSPNPLDAELAPTNPAMPDPVAAAPAAEPAPVAEPAADPTPATAAPAEPVAAPATTAAPSAPAAVAEGGAAKPQTMSAPRDGGPDNLKEIKGVGPKLETLLHEMGVYHFDQIAGWGPAEVAWMDSNLKGFKGRVSRDDWVAQAKILAAGGDTDFSSRVDKGEVY